MHNKRETYQRAKKLRMKKRRLQAMGAIISITIIFLGLLFGILVFGREKVTRDEIDREIIDLLAEETISNRVIYQDNEKSEQVDWKLVLVNRNHSIEPDYEPVLAEVENNYYFDARAVGALQQMLRDGRSEGLDFCICSAYRTIEKQTELFQNQIAQLINQGMSYEEACEEARTSVAYPGTSEHHLGLAVDIVARDYQLLDEKQADTPEARWLKENCWKYGFILRYPVDKTEKTGIIFEPWHYRYVGVEAAKEIMEQGICLEEYLGNE